MDEFKAWVELLLGSSYSYSQGQWLETEENADEQICAIRMSGGSAPIVDDRRQRLTVLLIGKRNDRSGIQQIKTDINALALAALDDSCPEGTVSVRATGEPVGPGYTKENRVWFQLDFQLIF